LNDCFRFLAAFLTLEGEHLALQSTGSGSRRIKLALPSQRRQAIDRNVSWDKPSLFRWARHGAFINVHRLGEMM